MSGELRGLSRWRRDSGKPSADGAPLSTLGSHHAKPYHTEVTAQDGAEEPVAGGYFLTRAVERPPYMAGDLLPERLLSLSQCICDFIPDVWAIEWTKVAEEDSAAKALKFGVPTSRCSDVVTWTTKRINNGTFGWPRVFLSVRDARRFASRFLKTCTKHRLLGIALHGKFVHDFLASERPPRGHGEPGVYRCVSRRLPADPGGGELGWEVLCYDHGDFHSWLCNGLEREIAKTLGIRPGPAGFLVDAQDALAAAEYCGRPEVGSEPGFWAPWLVTEYSFGG